MENFIHLFKEILEIEEKDINKDVNFRDLEEWDSLAVLSVLAMINDEYDITIPRARFKQANTIEELFNIINNEKRN